ncbi:MAG: bifunctional glycosyltransferase/class I SAM-dependent methyltransferase [Actinomycetota bacterium]
MDGPGEPRIVITMPAYRAQGTLERTVADIPSHLGAELILVDDASPDDTVRLARDLGIRVVVHSENLGYGGNQKTCYSEALRLGADIVVLLHPDYQYDPKAIPLLVAPILAGDADMTFGSRFAGLSDPRAGGMPMYRYVGNRLTSWVENLMLGSRFTEMHSGLRAYTRECLLSIPFLAYSKDFVFDSQFLVDAVTGGLRVVEVPIPTRYTEESSSIAILSSLEYVAQSLTYCGRKVASKGRRGSRTPLGSRARQGPVRLRRPGSIRKRECLLCGGQKQVLILPATAAGPPPVDAFACTSDALSSHDDILQCSGCGLMSSISGLDSEEIRQRYRRVTDELYLTEERARRELFHLIAGRMEGFFVRGRRLLEVGANVGLFLDVARSRGWEAWGIEPSEWAVRTGRDRFAVDLRVGTVEDLEEPEERYDAVVALDVLEHLSDPLGALLRLRRVLDEEGILVLTTVNVSGLHAKLRRRRWPWFIQIHLYYFSPETLAALLEKAGFQIVEWAILPRSFHMSYLARRAGLHGALGGALTTLAKLFDPKIPLGWLGDVQFAVARPMGRFPS